VAPRDLIAEKTSGLFRHACKAWPAVEDFSALKDFSLEVRRGEVISIIGRNGASKSTLPKLISRITEPNEGRDRAYRARRKHARGRHWLSSGADRP
jgi:lipopolysaccharide transport system ATP-binding protein